MSLDLNNVSTKFQFDWLANNRIIAGSLFSHFLASLFSKIFKKLLNTVMLNTAMAAMASTFLYLKDVS